MDTAYDRLVLFGATGDLAGRYLLPALASLRAAGRLPAGFEVIGAAHEDWTSARLREHAAERLARYAERVPPAVRAAVVAGLHYVPVDLDDAASVARAVHARGGATEPSVVYLALPPPLFPRTIEALCAAGLPDGSRLAIEKPFGTDLDSAVALNALAARFAGTAGEHAVYRVDYALGTATAQNLLLMRALNPALEALWSAAHVEQVEVRWEETLAMEGRGAFYDRTGALRDVMQNHMMQVLCLLAMELPSSMDARELRARKAELLRAVRPPRPEDMAALTLRARYTAGTVGDPPRAVPAYVDEPGVDASRQTETFAQVVLAIDNPRWAGTRFLLSAGKALARTRREVVLRFRRPEQLPLPCDIAALPPAELRIGIDGPEDIALELGGHAADDPAHPVRLTLRSPPPPSELPAYGHVLSDLLGGRSTLSVGAKVAEEAWRIVMPVLRAWAEGRVPLREYPAGSRGPMVEGTSPRAAAAGRT